MTAGSSMASAAKAVAAAVARVSESLSDEVRLDLLLRSLGARLPDAVSAAAVRETLGALPTDLSALGTAAAAVDPSTADATAVAGQTAALLAALGAVTADLRNIGKNPPKGLPPPLDSAQFWELFAKNVLEQAIAERLAQRAPRLRAILRLLGVVQDAVIDVSTSSVVAPATMRWDKLGDLLTDPAGLVRSTYGWGSQLQDRLLLGAAADLGRACGLQLGTFPTQPAVLQGFWDPPSPTAAGGPGAFLAVPILDRATTQPDLVQRAISIDVFPIPVDGTRSGNPVGIAAYLVADAGMSATITMSPVFQVSVSGDLEAGAGISLRPTGSSFTLDSGAAAQAQVSITAAGHPPQPWIVGDLNSTRLEITSLSFEFSAAAATGAGGRDMLGLKVSGDFVAHLDLGWADSFTSGLLGGVTRALPFSAALSWTSTGGLRFDGGIAATGTGNTRTLLSTTIPVGLDVAGILRVTAITIEGVPIQQGGELRLLASGSVTLGPLTVILDRIGLALRLTDPGEGVGNLGPLDLGFGLSGPAGVGLTVTAPMVSGGGYLQADPANGRYVGAVIAKVGTVTVDGVGVLDTKIPGGQWSIIALADVDGLSIQLGFGLQLTGIGVLIGVNRSINTTGLQALARSGSLRTVLFPPGLATDAPRIAAGLDTLFPPAPGQYVLGPVAKLAWGSQGLVTAELAIYIELPSPIRIAVLGAIDINLPSAAAPVAQLHLDVLGVIDLPAQTASLDMSLTHSKLAGMPLTGQAALRAAWGPNGIFLLAVGGFHPHFPPPPAFPSLQRIGLSYSGGPLVIQMRSYLAVTTNTVQFGSQIDLRATAGPAALTATAGFDALVQFRPFHLELDLVIQAAITLYGKAVLALQVDVHLSGPGPWHLNGQVSFQVLFARFTIPISGTFGAPTALTAPSPVDLLALLTEAVADPANWMLTTPPGTPTITLRDGAAGAGLHPLGGLALHQRTAPLELALDRYGPDPLAHQTTLSVAAGGRSSRTDPVTDLFAPAQFVAIPDVQALTAPSFQALTSGLTLTPDATVIPADAGNSDAQPNAAPTSTVSTRDWDLTVVDLAPPPAPAPPSPAPAAPAPALAAAELVVSHQAGAAVTGLAAATDSTDSLYTGPAHGIAPSPARYAIVDNPFITNPIATGIQTDVAGPLVWFGAQVLTLTATRPGQLVVYASELAGTGDGHG